MPLQGPFHKTGCQKGQRSPSKMGFPCMPSFLDLPSPLSISPVSLQQLMPRVHDVALL